MLGTLTALTDPTGLAPFTLMAFDSSGTKILNATANNDGFLDATSGPIEVAVIPALTTLRVNFPCGANIDSTHCAVVDSQEQSATVPGNPETLYDLNISIKGVVEGKTYTGGTPQGSILVGGSPDNTTFNYYVLAVSSPATNYYLNDETLLPYLFDAPPDVINYSGTIQAHGGATITLRAVSVDDEELRNINAASAPGVVNLLPNQGQFVEVLFA